MDHLLRIGIERFIINTHHCPEVYLQEFPNHQWRGKPLIFRHEPILLDTAGGLKNIEDLLDDDESILCYNGDIVSNLPLQHLLNHHEAQRPEATMVLRSSGHLLNVNIDQQGRVCDIRNVLKDPGIGSCLFTGIYAIETSILRHIEKGRIESIVSTFIDRIRERPGSIGGIVIDEGDWYDIGSIEEYQRLQCKMETPEG
jgi:NDP-sugar pyrophosphorylase family protein